MCRALHVLCGAADRESLAALKRHVVSKEYELTGGATTAEELLGQVVELEPDAVVLDAALVSAAERLRAEHPSIRLIMVGVESEAADDWVERAEDARAAVLGLPRPGGPVR